MKTAYAHCTPISVSYPNIIHLRQAARLTGAKRFFLCVWDPVVFEDPAFFSRGDGKRSRMERLQENARIHQRILELEGVEVTTIYLSEAWSRLFSKPQLARTFNAILSKVKVSDLLKRQGLPGEDLTLSRINYIIADFLAASMLPDLFPELSATAPGIYATSRRLAPLLPAIKAVMEDPQARHPIPEIAWISPFPVIIDSKGLIPSMEMSPEQIEHVLLDGHTVRAFDHHAVSKIYSLMDVSKPAFPRTWSVQKLAEILSNDLHCWFGDIKRSLQKPAPQGPKSLRVTSPDEFHRSVRPLSAVKLRILSLCDGTKTSYHIAKALGLKQVTASVYLGRLRTLGLVTQGRRPVRTVSSVVVDFEAMKPNV